jgi:signal transduction histidine kinase
VLRRSDGTYGPADEISIPASLIKKVRREAVENTTKLILHELYPHIGLVANSASQEIDRYADSRTFAHVTALKKALESVELIAVTAAPPKIQEFDLSLLIKDIVDTEFSEYSLVIAREGPAPLLVETDQRLLQHAIRNGLKNALEASLLAQPLSQHAITINWNKTDIDYWVSILDTGPGIVGSSEAAFRPGTSTKEGHTGFGLVVARQAMETLDGEAKLGPARNGGAIFELRWPRL